MNESFDKKNPYKFSTAPKINLKIKTCASFNLQLRKDQSRRRCFYLYPKNLPGKLPV
jgi:hypothetical protein